MAKKRHNLRANGEKTKDKWRREWLVRNGTRTKSHFYKFSKVSRQLVPSNSRRTPSIFFPSLQAALCLFFHLRSPASFPFPFRKKAQPIARSSWTFMETTRTERNRSTTRQIDRVLALRAIILPLARFRDPAFKSTRDEQFPATKRDATNVGESKRLVVLPFCVNERRFFFEKMANVFEYFSDLNI